MTNENLPQQLRLVPIDVPVQFRLDAATRDRGRRHIAEIRRQMAERKAARLAEAAAAERPAPQRAA